MAIRIEIEPVDFYCRYCDSAMEDTGCAACGGYRCLNCGAGCDIKDTDGWCAAATAHMSDVEHREHRGHKRLAGFYRNREADTHASETDTP